MAAAVSAEDDDRPVRGAEAVGAIGDEALLLQDSLDLRFEAALFEQGPLQIAIGGQGCGTRRNRPGDDREGAKEAGASTASAASTG